MENLKQRLMQAILPPNDIRHIMPRHDELPFAEMKLLGHIKQLSETQSEVTVASIRDRIPVSKPAISQALNALENKGYISRTISQGDRRVTALKLTGRGDALIGEKMRHMDSFLDRLIREVGPENIEKLIGLLALIHTKAREINESEKR